MRDSIHIGARPWGGGTREVKDSFNQGIKDKLDGKPNWADEVLENLSLEKIRELETRARQSEEQKRRRDAHPNEYEKFLELCPDFDNDPDPQNNNFGAIIADFRLRQLDPTTSNAQDLRESWQRVKAAMPDVLRIKQEYVKKQNAASAKEILEREAFNEEDAYTMPMDKLRQRARGIF
jgi:hypothetical protein